MNNEESSDIKELKKEITRLREETMKRLDKHADKQNEILHQLPASESLQTKSDCQEKHRTQRWFMGLIGMAMAGLATWVLYLHMGFADLRAKISQLLRGI